MSDESGKRKLGRGLSALLGDDNAADYASLDKVRSAKTVPIEQLRANTYQPRYRWDEEKLDDLVESIRDKGILQPILVRRDPQDPNKYEIVAGERRWRAAQKAQLHEVPINVRDLTDADSLEIALIENIQRQDLTAVEEAQGYKRLMEEFSYTQEQLAHGVGKSRSHVANQIRLLSLPESVLVMVDDGRLAPGAARTLITAENPEELAKEIVAKGLNVRQAEKLSKKKNQGVQHRHRSDKDPDTISLEEDLSAALGMKVSIDHQGDKGGQVKIAYHSLDQLDEICRRLSRHAEMAAHGEGPAPHGREMAGDDEETVSESELRAAMEADFAELDKN